MMPLPFLLGLRSYQLHTPGFIFIFNFNFKFNFNGKLEVRL